MHCSYFTQYWENFYANMYIQKLHMFIIDMDVNIYAYMFGKL